MSSCSPRLHATDWKQGQILEEADDPYRCNYPLQAKFLAYKDPSEQQEMVEAEGASLSHEYTT